MQTMSDARHAPQIREVVDAVTGDDELGPFTLLPGTWSNEPGLAGRGWNMIALPFGPPPGATFRPPFRLLLNQYNENLVFDLVDKKVPNRGIAPSADGPTPADQLLVALDYEQGVKQVVAEDFPSTGLGGQPGAAIHHEPGLFLRMSDPLDEDATEIARLATIPHGDSVLAMGTVKVVDGPPQIPDLNALPLGVGQDVDTNRYLAPYKHFRDSLFQGLFDPAKPADLLRRANEGVDIVRTTELTFDSTLPTGGIANIPFITRQANATEMRSTFWIEEVREQDGSESLRLQYLQIVQLDFFPRQDAGPGRIKWPHVSINTLAKLPPEQTPDRAYAVMPS